MTARLAIARSRRAGLKAVSGIALGTVCWAAAGCFGVRTLFIAAVDILVHQGYCREHFTAREIGHDSPYLGASCARSAFAACAIAAKPPRFSTLIAAMTPMFRAGAKAA
jgi:hypothetical protein